MPEEIFYIDSSKFDIDNLLGGNVVKGIETLEKSFGVSVNIRDSNFRIRASSKPQIQKTFKFLSKLVEIHSNSNKPISSESFDLLVKSFSNDKEQNNLMYTERIKVGKKKDDIIPRTPNQIAYTRSIREKDLIFGIGPAGTGKTYLAMAMAVSMFLEGKFSRIILTRPAREAGENLGFLPGTLEEKISPYLRPLYDALYDMLEPDEINTLMERRIIEVAPLAFMRGRTLNHSFIILDEAQNTSREQMLMFLTRLGFASKCIITGDPSQTDLANPKLSGLTEAAKILANIPEIAFVYFNSKDVVRHPLVEKIINAYAKRNQSSKKDIQK